MVASKGINYAFGQPSKEQLYIPTSREARYKSKAWVDSFGSRGSKAMGSLIKGFAGGSAVILLGTAMGISVIWVFASLYLGRKATHAVENNEIVC
jgi:AAA family ATP:ADP antiporter